MTVTVTVIDELMSTRCDIASDDVTYVVIFGLKADGQVTIVSGVFDEVTQHILTSNATTYVGTRVYTS